MRIYLALLGCLFVFSFLSHAQTDSGSLEVYLNDYLDNIPGNSGNDFDPANPTELGDWEDMLLDFLAGNLSEARDKAALLNYQIVMYTDTDYPEEPQYFIIEELSPTIHHWGSYVFRVNPCRAGLVLQAPHAKFDTNTGKQAVYCFSRLSARALFLAGTHRCNHNISVSCDGTTSVCTSGSAPYKISDLAHNTATPFQVSTEVLVEEIPSSVFIQLHGFAKQTSDPYVIMSNGSRETPENDYLADLEDALFDIDNSLSFKTGHLDLSWTRLLGFTNTQARAINGSVDPCETWVDQSEGRFMHIEQEKSKLREDATAWEKMNQALAQVFSCLPTSTNQIDPYDQPKIYPNPLSNTSLNIEGKAVHRISLFNIAGQLIFSQQLTTQDLSQIQLFGLSPGLYLVKLETEQAVYLQKLIKP